MSSEKRGSILLVVIAAVVVLFDQLLKYWVRNWLLIGDEQPLINGVVHLSHVSNEGAAWGMFAGQRWPLIAISVVVVVLLAATIRQIAARGTLVAIGMGLVFGGAIGNLIDRSLFGSVTDMIDMDTPIAAIRNFPVFNLADSALTVGVCFLLWHAWRHERATPGR